LNAPATQAMILAAPERMAPLIGPILTATGTEKPEWFHKARKRTGNALRPCGAGLEAGVDAAGPLSEDAASGSRDAAPSPSGCALRPTAGAGKPPRSALARSFAHAPPREGRHRSPPSSAGPARATWCPARVCRHVILKIVTPDTRVTFARFVAIS
jgi:hypothetical protein